MRETKIENVYSESGTVLDPGEAAVATTGGMTNLTLLLPELPDDVDVPRAVVYLTVCLMRWADDPEFVDEQISWFETSTRN